VSIVEVLVALVLLAIGLLGVAGNGAIAMRAPAARRASGVRHSVPRSPRDAPRAGVRSGAQRHARRSRCGAGGALDRRDRRGGAALVDAEVRWRAPRGQRVLLLRGGILC
jgi:hypothetical protein